MVSSEILQSSDLRGGRYYHLVNKITDEYCILSYLSNEWKNKFYYANMADPKSVMLHYRIYTVAPLVIGKVYV